jgi:hypothetical protein
MRGWIWGRALVAVSLAATLTVGTAPDLDATAASVVSPRMVLARDYCVVHGTYLPVVIVDHVMTTCSAGMFFSVAGPNTTPDLKPPYVRQVRDFCVGESMGLLAVRVSPHGLLSCDDGTLVTVAVSA